MYEVRSLAGRTKAAVIAVFVWLAFDVLHAMTSAYATAKGIDLSSGAEGLLALVSFIAYLACAIFVCRWIYRASANAHAHSADMSISPGWAIGWFFVPVATLFKPFQAMKEIWFESQSEHEDYGRKAPSNLTAWWTLWLVSKALGWVSFQSQGVAGGGYSGWIDLVSVSLAVPMSFLLIGIMKQVEAGQSEAGLSAVFA